MKQKRKYTHGPAYYEKSLEKQEKVRILRLCRELNATKGEAFIAALRALKSADFDSVLTASPAIAKRARETMAEINSPTVTSMTSQLVELKYHLQDAIDRNSIERKAAEAKHTELTVQLGKTRRELRKAALLVDMLSDEVCHLKDELDELDKLDKPGKICGCQQQ